MNIIEKRDFIHSYLHLANGNTINEFYEKLCKEEVLKAKLEKRALKSEDDINAGRVFSREEIENRDFSAQTRGMEFWEDEREDIYQDYLK